MRQAKKITLTETVVFEVGVGGVDHINVMYPIARVYTKDDARPINEVFLQVGSTIEWLTDE